MNLHRFLLLPLLCLSGCASLPQSNPNGAITALRNLPDKYRTSAVKVSATTSIAVPPTWYIKARNYNDQDKMYLVTVTKGLMRHASRVPEKEVVGGVFKTTYPINRHKMLVDSDGAWNAATKYCTSKGASLATGKVALTQKDAVSDPIWTVRCYDANNGYIGTIVILATTGTVVSSN
ncbi:MAG: hypothetical protein ABI615_12000 [Chthoniobacterales bacterium]